MPFKPGDAVSMHGVFLGFVINTDFGGEQVVISQTGSVMETLYRYDTANLDPEPMSQLVTGAPEPVVLPPEPRRTAWEHLLEDDEC